MDAAPAPLLPKRARRQDPPAELDQLDLFQLAERINTEHEAAVVVAGKLAGHAMEIGRLLLQAQAKVKADGASWIEWVEGNLPFGRMEASRYLRVAKADVTRVLHPETGGRSLRGALRELVAPRDDSGEQPGLADPPSAPPSTEEDEAFDPERPLGKVASAIFAALNTWPPEHKPKLAELASRLRKFAEMIEGRLK